MCQFCRKSRHYTTTDISEMDTSHRIVQFFKSIWEFVKKAGRIVAHTELFHNEKGVLIVVVSLVFVMVVCSCSCCAQYLDEKDWENNPISEPTPDRFICPTLESLSLNPKKKKKFQDSELGSS